MTEAKRPRCSDQSLLRDDPMYGTASAGHSWAMLELSGAWGHSAFLGSPSIVDPQLGRSIARHFETAGMRIAAIRRPGKRDTTPRWRWFIAHSDEGREALWTGEVGGPEEYLELAPDGSDGRPCPDPLVAICAHGRHDQCCAVRGRGACAAIAAEYPDITWECSHLGGDRFAATMLVLPEGLCYGRVDSADSADLIRLYFDGRLHNGFLRGRTSLPHAVQAAQYFAREATGEDRIHALSPLDVVHDDGRITVRLRGRSGPVDVVLTEKMSDPLLSMCSAKVEGSVRTFVFESMS